MTSLRLWSPSVLTPDGWRHDAMLHIHAGRITAIEAGQAPGDAARLPGPVLPGLVNAHSHAFQRAMAGLAERAGPATDSFWTWREVMYRFLAALTPEMVQAIAAWLYMELLENGYTAIAEFHYLHHQPDGRPYADPAEMSRRHIAAAESAGLRLCLLPCFYATGNFGGAPPSPGQTRFLHDVDDFLRLLDSLPRQGAAIHSLRAATPDHIRALLPALAGRPIHMHIAEQPKEIADCLAWCGARPMAWLLDNVDVDAGWNLVHATHATAPELQALAARGAGIVLCPTTEANLGDGVPLLADWQAAGGRIAIGGDSHVGLEAAAELRWLDYGQRLRHISRNTLAVPPRSSGRSLWDAAVAGGSAAIAAPAGLAVGAPADFIVLDGAHPLLQGAGGDLILDRLIYADSRRPMIAETHVGGVRLVERGRHRDRERIDAAVAPVLARLMAG